MVVVLFVGVRSNSHETVGIAVKIAVSFGAKKRVPTRFISRCMNDREELHMREQVSNG